METKKLSEALAELQAAASVSGLDVRLVVAGQTDTDNAQTITLQQLLTALNVPTAQSGTQGTTKNYIYSTGIDADKNCVASCNWWIYSEMVEYMFVGIDGALIIILIMTMIMKHIKLHNI